MQEDYADLETRAGIAQSSLDLIRDHRDRLELQLALIIWDVMRLDAGP